MSSMTCIMHRCDNPCHATGNRFCADHMIEYLQKQVGNNRTLRDWFAGQAMASAGTWTPAHGGTDLGSKAAMKARALWAYEQADAMLAERAGTSD